MIGQPHSLGGGLLPMSLADPAESVFAERLLHVKRGMRSGKMIRCTDLKKATAYFLLDKLLTGGWISESAEQAGRRPARRVFAITPAGEVAFQRLPRSNLAGWSRARLPGDIGLTFVVALDPAEASQLLRQRRDGG